MHGKERVSKSDGHLTADYAPTRRLLAITLRWFTLERLVVISLPFMFFTSLTGSMHIAVADLIFPLLAALTLAGPASDRQSVALRPLVLFALAMLAVVIMSSLTASLFDPYFIPRLAITNAFKLCVVFLYAVVFALIASKFDPDELYSFLRTWAWTSTIVALATIMTAARLFNIVPFSADGSRSPGFFQDPNLYGGYLVLSVAVIVAADVLRRSYWTTVQLVSVVVAIVLTASRGALISLALVLLMAVIFVATWKVRMIASAAGLGAAFLLYASGPGMFATWLAPAIDRLTTSGRAVGDDPRPRIWQRAIALWNEHPVFGVGIGQFGRYTIDVNGIDDNNVGQIAHNTFLSFLVENGIFGFILCVTGIAFLAVRLYCDRRLHLRLRHALGLGVLVICAEMFTLNFQNVRYVWIFIGIVWGYTLWKPHVNPVDTIHRISTDATSE